jgi:CheY-like chemotaxis protein
MSVNEGKDVLDFLIDVLKEHDVNLNEVIKKLEERSHSLDAKEITSEEKALIEKLRREVERSDSTKPEILVVDDDEMLTFTVGAILENAGYNVEIVPSGEKAIERNSEKKFDLIFMDMKLPDINGDEVARIMADQGKVTKIILMTGYEKFAEEVKNQPVNIKKVLLKPVNPEDLVNVTKTVLKNLE